MKCISNLITNEGSEVRTKIDPIVGCSLIQEGAPTTLLADAGGALFNRYDRARAVLSGVDLRSWEKRGLPPSVAPL